MRYVPSSAPMLTRTCQFVSWAVTRTRSRSVWLWVSRCEGKGPNA
jgi:hypothetical protein